MTQAPPPAALIDWNDMEPAGSIKPNLKGLGVATAVVAAGVLSIAQPAIAATLAAGAVLGAASQRF